MNIVKLSKVLGILGFGFSALAMITSGLNNLITPAIMEAKLEMKMEQQMAKMFADFCKK